MYIQTKDLDDNMDEEEAQDDQDDENEEDLEADAEEGNEANEAEQAEEETGAAKDFTTERTRLRKAVSDAGDRLDAAEGSNKAKESEIIYKIQNKRQIGTRLKQVPGPPYKYYDGTVRKYKDEDYAQEIEMANYEHRLENINKKIKGEKAKEPAYAGASRAADKLIVKEKERIAKEDKELAAKKAHEKKMREWMGY
jgi:hypothetical protein